MKITIQTGSDIDIKHLGLEQLQNEYVQVDKAKSLTYSLSGEEIQNILLIVIPSGIITNATYDLIKSTCKLLIQSLRQKIYTVEYPLKVTVNGIVHTLADEASITSLNTEILEQINEELVVEKDSDAR
mgnify:CR=1 FL=1